MPGTISAHRRKSKSRPGPPLTRILRAGLLMLLATAACGVRAGLAAPAASMAVADSLFNAGGFGEAARVYEAVSAREPGNGRAWYRLGTCRMRLGRYDEALAALHKSESIGHNPTVMYNLACAYARLARPDPAFEWLEKSIAAGFSQLAQLEADPDLASLRALPGYAGIRTSLAKAARPCAYRAEARQFDFWLGSWEVKDVAGNSVGHNDVLLQLGDCVLQENWTDGYGNSGKSMNFFNASSGHWQQTWVDDKGTVLELTGDRVGDEMRFRGETKGPNGQSVLNRLTFFSLTPDHVRQLGESSSDGGATWTTNYDFHYFRKSG